MKFDQLTAHAEGKLLTGIVDRVGHVVINNPERHNAISLAMYQAGAAEVNRMAADPEARLLVVRGAGGKAFASGADISKFEKERSSAEDVSKYSEASKAFYDSVFHFPKPTIAMIQGYCIGGGMGLAVACDIRLCEDKSRFAIPAAKLGLGYGYEGIRRLANLVGPAMVKEIFFTARQFSAGEAQEMGLVNRMLPPHMLVPYVDDYAKRISENAPMTIESVKAIVQAIQDDESARDLDALDAMVKACFASQDYIEGRRAFMEKRKPDFTGS